MTCDDEDHGRSRRSGAEDRDVRTGRILGGRQSRGQVAPCAICI
jgi:hypothetical protein